MKKISCSHKGIQFIKSDVYNSRNHQQREYESGYSSYEFEIGKRGKRLNKWN